MSNPRTVSSAPRSESTYQSTSLRETHSDYHGGSHPILRGIVSALLAVAFYGLIVFLFSSLFLLISAMEAGTDLTSSIGAFSTSLLILSQGIGIKTAELYMTVVPLGFTLLSIYILRTMMIRRRTSVLGNIASVLTWTIFFCALSWYSHNNVIGSLWYLPLKPLCIALIAWAISCTAESHEYAFVKSKIDKFWSVPIKKTIILGFKNARRVFLLFLSISIITFIVWVILGVSSMSSVFAMTNMGLGSRILTTFLSLAWLPNLLLWALSWITGAGFKIGVLGSFTLWEGKSTDLPPIPVFGLFPQEIPSDTARLVILLIPTVCIAAIGLYTQLNKNEFNVLALKTKMNIAVNFLYAAGSLIISIILSVMLFGVLFLCSNGSLGSKNLKALGIDVAQSLSAIGRPLAWGFISAWLIAVAITIIQYVLRFISAQTSHVSSVDSPAFSSFDDDTDAQLRKTQTPSDTQEEKISPINPTHESEE